jgi:hypothetical protein
MISRIIDASSTERLLNKGTGHDSLPPNEVAQVLERIMMHKRTYLNIGIEGKEYVNFI